MNTTEDFARSDVVDSDMTVLTPEDVTGQNVDSTDEVENLRNSLREAMHDDSIQPKMQCLMMDSSFSMVTMQGEDSGIEWETTPSRCTTPWASEAGNVSVDLGSAAAARPATPGSHPAGKIIFVMDEDLMSRRKKERVSSKRKADRQREVLGESSENISGRPELVEVSQPNLKAEGEGDQEEPTDPGEDKEQLLFTLVSEGSEILNIVVPPKLATVDEEESKEMVDNLSYLEESLVPKATAEIHDSELLFVSIETEDQVKPAPVPGSMDPPGAPVARPPVRGAPGNVDYFEAFNLIDAQAPGSPAVITQKPEEPEAEAAAESQDTDKPEPARDSTITTTVDKSDTISVEEMTSELLDEVFYGGTDDAVMKSLDSADKGGAAKGAPCRLPSKPSGSNLFGSQEEILTPIFLPDGPPKIIDPILLEEPKAMAFLYTDLYEEATGSRKKEEDTESLNSEKSFHSRHSDREARGYLEKYVLIDETPVVDVEPTDAEEQPKEGPRVLTQDLYDFAATTPEKVEMPTSEEEITDFFRASDNSSPCDIEPFSRSSPEDDEPQTTKTKAKTERSVSIAAEKVTEEVPTDPLSISSFEFPSEEPDWEFTDNHPALDEKESVHAGQEVWREDEELRPAAPPRMKAASSPKACLDLTPLTPVDVVTQEKEEGGEKEEREEEKETASPVETADEGDGDGEEVMKVSSEVTLSEEELAKTATESEKTVKAEEKDTKTDEEEERRETEAAATQTEGEEEEEDAKSPETDTTEIQPEKQEDTAAAVSPETPKNKGQCVIL
ncbi:cardiomyopathy-associated protein 5 [Parambassis ranga]|uniref:Cardiomyopathy-associated protein 5 n=1 Tax=Parambassis ranga TaxID=210632 RepID=A0A6P7JEQ7_9TELE|nr:cardiomyopathy-associated protein 5 [Parambassis ranga]